MHREIFLLFKPVSLRRKAGDDLAILDNCGRVKVELVGKLKGDKTFEESVAAVGIIAESLEKDRTLVVGNDGHEYN